MKISTIVAATENGVIGKNNTLPWRMPTDMKFFKDKTMGHVVITGRKNYESIPPAFRPLPGRTNIVITRQENYEAPGAMIAHSIEEALEIARSKGETECFIIGGADVFRQSEKFCDTLYLTRIHTKMEGHAFFDDPDMKVWKEVSSEKHPADQKNPWDFTFIKLEKK